MLKIMFEDLKVRIAYKKLGLYLKIRPRFRDFQTIFRNQAFWKTGVTLPFSTFLRSVFFPNTFLYIKLIISIIKIRC